MPSWEDVMREVLEERAGVLRALVEYDQEGAGSPPDPNCWRCRGQGEFPLVVDERTGETEIVTCLCAYPGQEG